MKPLSTGGRLAVLNAGVLAGGMLVLGVVMFGVVDHVLVREAEGLLRDEFEEVAVALRRRPLDPEAMVEALEEEVLEHRNVSLAFRVASGTGTELARSNSPVWTLPIPPFEAGTLVRDSRTVRAPGTGERFRVMHRRVPSLSFGAVDLEAAIRLSAADAARESLADVSLVLGPALLLGALAAGSALARRARAEERPPA